MDENKENQTPEVVQQQGELDWVQQYSLDQEREEQELQQALAQSLQEHVGNSPFSVIFISLPPFLLFFLPLSLPPFLNPSLPSTFPSFLLSSLLPPHFLTSSLSSFLSCFLPSSLCSSIPLFLLSFLPSLLPSFFPS